MAFGISTDGGKTWLKDLDSNSSTKIGSYNKAKNRWITLASIKMDNTTPPPPPPPSPPAPNPETPVLGIVDVINFSTTDSDDKVGQWVDAVQQQANNDISKFWTYTVQMNVIPKSQAPKKGHWYCGFFDNSSQAGVLGWHDVGPNNEPLIKVFTKESENFGLSPSITLSHEIAESIGDPNANTTIKGKDESGKPCLYFRENCDPVEALTYKVGSIEVSDFVTPTWWVENTSTLYDKLGKVSKPYQILKGGYMEISYDNGRTWTEKDNFSKHAARHRTPSSRYNLYKKPIEERIKSTFQTK